MGLGAMAPRCCVFTMTDVESIRASGQGPHFRLGFDEVKLHEFHDVLP